MKTDLTALLVGLGLLGLIGITAAASAHFGGGPLSNLTPEDMASRFTAMFQQKADLLGISVDEYKQAWTEGKGFSQIAEEQGITQEQLQQKLTEQRQQQIQEQLNALVQQGVITQQQADQRLNAFQARLENGDLNRGFGGCGYRGMMKSNW